MKNKKNKIFGITGAVLFFIPLVSEAAVTWQIIVQCGKTIPCTLNDVGPTINHLIGDLAILTIPMAVIAYAYGGVLLILSPSDPGKMKEGMEVIKNTTWGIALVFIAYVIIQLVVLVLGLKGSSWLG